MRLSRGEKEPRIITIRECIVYPLLSDTATALTAMSFTFRMMR
jgi:hypothetical protein